MVGARRKWPACYLHFLVLMAPVMLSTLLPVSASSSSSNGKSDHGSESVQGGNLLESPRISAFSTNDSGLSHRGTMRISSESVLNETFVGISRHLLNTPEKLHPLRVDEKLGEDDDLSPVTSSDSIPSEKSRQKRSYDRFSSDRLTLIDFDSDPQSIREGSEAVRSELLRSMVVASVIFVSVSMGVCLVFTVRFACFLRGSVHRNLILLNEKLTALDSRLGTRQLPDPLLQQLCDAIGASADTVKDEQHQALADIANVERMLRNERVEKVNEPIYATQYGLKDVFDPKFAATIPTGTGGGTTTSSQPPSSSAADGGPELIFGSPPRAEDEAKKKHAYETYGGGKITAGKVEEKTKHAYESYGGGKIMVSRNEKRGNKGDPPTCEATQDEPNRDHEIRPPAFAAMAEENDPNYETLHGLDNNKVFQGKFKAGGGSKENSNEKEIKPPKVAGMAAENDPNYETLHGIDNNKVFTDKGKGQEGQAGSGRTDIRPPKVAAMAAENDPNYETLRGIDNAKVFEKKTKTKTVAKTRVSRFSKEAATQDSRQTIAPKLSKKQSAEVAKDTEKQIRPPAFSAMVDANNENYETLHGLKNDDVFKNKRK